MKTTGLRLMGLLIFGFAASTPYLPAQTDPLNPSASQAQPNQPGRVQPSTASLRDSSGAPNETTQQLKDKFFLRKATEDGLAQVQLGQLASTNGNSPEVKELGQKLADEHEKLNASMAVVADTIGVRLPKKLSKSDQETYEKLKALSGEAFDKEYLTCMVRDHHDDLRDFRIESQTTNETQLKETADEGSKMIREHLGAVIRLARLNGVPLPKRGDHPQPPPVQ
jgi:putative membrane protein